MDEAYAGMNLVLQNKADPVQAGLFLIALRMKRETNAELLGVQKALREAVCHVEVTVDELVEIADPFNGYTRGLPVSAFLAPLMAACGVPAVCHGVRAVGPKYGVTHHQVLAAAGCEVGLDPKSVADRVQDPAIGWSYIDQRVSCPDLYQLVELRDLMVKRTCLTTIEVALKPLSARKRTHLITGYVHKPYPPIYTMLARHAGYQSALIVRGVEGGVVPSLQQPSKAVQFYGASADRELRIEPGMAGITDASNRALPIPEYLKGRIQEDEEIDAGAMANAAVEAGIAALSGQRGLAYDSLVYSGALLLAHIKQVPISECVKRIKTVLDSGAAGERLKL